MRPSVLLLLSLALALPACRPLIVDAVAPPGGVYRQDAGCVVTDDLSCPLDLERRFGFETPNVESVQAFTPSTVSQLQVTCTHSFCGTGSLRAQATLSYAGSPEDARLSNVRFKVDPPVDLRGKTISARVFVEQILPRRRDGFDTPMNALIGVVEEAGVWHKVTDGPLDQNNSAWHTVSGPVESVPDAGEAALLSPVTFIEVQVYLSRPYQDGARFEASLYYDEVGWR